MRPYIKLAGKCVAVMLPLIALMFVFSHCTLSFIDGEAPYYMWNKEVSNAAQDKYYDTVILGDSTANSDYMPEILSDSTINLSLGGTTPLENYYTLQDWLEHHEPPKTCYISFMEYHFQTLATSFWRRAMYAHRYSLRDSMAMLRAAAAAGDETVVGKHYLLDFISYEAWLPNKYITAFMNANFNQRQTSNVKSIALAELHKGRYLGRTVEQYVPAEGQTVSAFSVSPLLDGYYKELIELCIENDIQVRLVRLPVPEDCVFTKEYSEGFYAYYDALQAEYPGVTVDWFPLYENECFMDTHHMNSYGALRFSTELKALHPEDFEGAPLTDSQSAGINDYLKSETDLAHLFDWIAGRDYTVILCDAQGLSDNIFNGNSEEIRPATSDVPLVVRRADNVQETSGGGYCMSLV